MSNLLEKLKQKGFEEIDNRLIKKDSEYTIIINPQTSQVWGFYGNIDFSKQHLEQRFEQMDLDLEIEQRGISYFLKTDELISKKQDIVKPDIMPSIDDMLQLAPYISSDELEEGINIKFLTAWEKTGEWNYKGRVTSKYSIFVIKKDGDSAQMRRIDCGRNLISHLIGAMFIANIKDLRGIDAFIQRIGSKQNTRYKIQFKKDKD